ncbi:MAG: hypothetical protein A2166_00355 [Omnitrophica WOR_2 bacterium RBG_13_41_10]|nr:MAG: hypothetical protein A2166_00355 [Omnitrophica WOR_2 bacterium RBG_13_41_10]
MNYRSIIKLAILCLLTIFAYFPTLIWMVSRWTEKDTYYSHGILVPFISGFIVWLKRKELAKIEFKCLTAKAILCMIAL